MSDIIGAATRGRLGKVIDLFGRCSNADAKAALMAAARHGHLETVRWLYYALLRMKPPMPMPRGLRECLMTVAPADVELEAWRHGHWHIVNIAE